MESLKEHASAINVISDVMLKVTEEEVIVEIDGIRGEVLGGQAREVRELLASAAVQFIQETTRSRRAEQRMMQARGYPEGDVAGSLDPVYTVGSTGRVQRYAG